MAVLLDGHLRLDPGPARRPRRDHLIFSKGHASPLFYACSRRPGRSATTSCSPSASSAAASRDTRRRSCPGSTWPPARSARDCRRRRPRARRASGWTAPPTRVWVLCGDSEMAEGSIWEAFDHAGVRAARQPHRDRRRQPARPARRDRCTAGTSTPTPRAPGRSAGTPIEVDGHDVDAIERAYGEAERTAGKPTAIIARTKKGAGVAAVEDQEGMHGKPLTTRTRRSRELGGERDLARARSPSPADAAAAPLRGARRPSCPRYEIGRRGRDPRGLRRGAQCARRRPRRRRRRSTARSSNSTYSEIFARRPPRALLRVYIAEQQLVAARGRRCSGAAGAPFGSTFAAFLTRAYDFIRMAAVSRANIRLCGSHAGVSIGEDGPSQMGLEDLAAFRAVHSSTVLYPCDANQTARLVEQMADLDGHRLPAHPPRRPAGDLRTRRELPGRRQQGASATGDDVTLVARRRDRARGARGRRAARRRRASRPGSSTCTRSSRSTRQTLARAAAETGGIVTVEDHWPEGGLGDAVLDALSGAGRDRSRA